MNKPIRREFLRKLIKEKIKETKKYIWISSKRYSIHQDIEYYYIFRINKETEKTEYIGIWQAK